MQIHSRRIRRELDKLVQSEHDVDVTPLKGRSGFRLRVGGYQVIFERDEADRSINVLRIGPRGDVDKELGGRHD